VGNLVQLADVHTYLQITYTTDDTLLSQLIANYSEAIEQYCRQSFSAQIPQTDYLDGDVPELIVKHRPIAALASLVDMSQRLSQLQIGIGNGVQTAFSGAVAGGPWIPGSIQIVAGSVVAIDDGAGNLTGTGIAAGSTFNYATGAALINFSAAPGAGVVVKFAGNPTSAIVDPSIYQVDDLAGLIIAQPTPPSDFPLAGGTFSWFQSTPVWARGRRRWQINYTQGYAAVPADVQQACLICVAERYNRRDPLGAETVGDYSYKTEPGSSSGFSAQVEQLLKPYFELVV
jgi:hypothetical protein